MVSSPPAEYRPKIAKPACASNHCISRCSYGYHCYPQFTGERKGSYLGAIVLAAAIGLLFIFGVVI